MNEVREVNEVRFHRRRAISSEGVVPEIAPWNPETPHQRFTYLDSLQKSSEVARDALIWTSRKMAASRCTKTVPWPGRRENVMFNKRRCSLFKKANELSGKTGRELYIVMHRGHYFTYNSTDRFRWESHRPGWFSCRRVRNGRFAIMITEYPSAEISQIHRLPDENGLDATPLASIYTMYVIEEKKLPVLLISQVVRTCTSSPRTLSRSVHYKSRYRWPGL